MRSFTSSYLLTLLPYLISGLTFHLKSRGTSLPPADYLRDIDRAYRSLLRNKFRLQVWQNFRDEVSFRLRHHLPEDLAPVSVHVGPKVIFQRRDLTVPFFS
jgi:hypothetical protein